MHKSDVRIAVSACLLGKQVRYDAKDKLDPFLTYTWGKKVDFVPLCPETGAGLGVPREMSRLEEINGAVRMLGQESGKDYTDAIERWSAKTLDEFKTQNVIGFILKNNSPSCGLSVAGGQNRVFHNGVFAGYLRQKLPLVPLVDEKTLYEPDMRDLFVSRMFLLWRFRQVMDLSMDRAGLADYHNKNKLWLMAHSLEHFKRLGRIAARPGNVKNEDRFNAYSSELLELLTNKATVENHANVLLHIENHFKKVISAEEQSEFHSAVQAFADGRASLAAPITLANHHARKHRLPFLGVQTYLNPHPLEIKLRHA